MSLQSENARIVHIRNFRFSRGRGSATEREQMAFSNESGTAIGDGHAADGAVTCAARNSIYLLCFSAHAF